MEPLYMIGHSNHTWEKFLSLLTQHHVKRLLDVRTSPRSRWNPQFEAKNMKPALEAAGIEYVHLQALGGKNPLPAAELQKQLEPLIPFPDGTCMMCSEGDYLQCHRHYLLAPVLLQLGVTIQQIGRDGSLVMDSGPSAKTLAKMAAFIPSGAAPGNGGDDQKAFLFP